MRIANVNGRAVLVVAEAHGFDLHTASGGHLPADPDDLLQRWPDLCSWHRGQSRLGFDSDEVRFDPADLGPVVRRPHQIFAVGLNYGAHSEEAGFAGSKQPVIFTKFTSSLGGAESVVVLSSPSVDWEAELVVIVGSGGRNIAAADAWGHVAGLAVGQDLSDRTLQFAAPPAQFSLAKSFEGYAPIGPWLVTPDEFDDPDDIALGCILNGEPLQSDRTHNMIFDVRQLVAYLSNVVELQPGDLIFTGTPSGVGMGYDPPRYLQPGDELVTWAQGIGEIRQRFAEPAASGLVTNAQEEDLASGQRA